jgi:ribosomal protein S18 acetylase RimI-like enzyme
MTVRERAALLPMIRRYEDRDHDAVYEICLLTGNSGTDATGMYASDDLLSDIFAGPYVHIEPGLAFVVDNGARVVGYVMGTANTEQFVRRCRAEWIPMMEGRYEEPPDLPETVDDKMLQLHFSPEKMLWSGLDEYPAHLHIDLLPEYQGQGYGRRLVDRFFGAVASQGARGVHVSVSASNERAFGFYQRLGFTHREVMHSSAAKYFVRSLDDYLE